MDIDICIYICIYTERYIGHLGRRLRSRTNGVNTNGAAAKVMNFAGFDRELLVYKLNKRTSSKNSN